MQSNDSTAQSHPAQNKGWLRPYLFQLDLMFSKRWDYWLRTLVTGKILPEPIPQIQWLETPHRDPEKNLTTTLQLCLHQTVFEAFRLFVDWLLYGFGDASVAEFPPGIDPSLNVKWYQTFNLGLSLKFPYDYLGHYAADLYKSGSRNPTGYFPTPMSLSSAMAKRLLQKQDKTASVCDPCVGSGRLLMAASNYSLNLYGMDIDPLILKVCRVNMWCYVPWSIYRPKWLKGIDWVQTPLSQKHPPMREKSVQLNLFERNKVMK